MIYLATPHSVTPYVQLLNHHELEDLRIWREQAAILTMTYYQALGENIYSPIAHNNQGDRWFKEFIAHSGTTEYEHYQRWDEHMIQLASEFWLLAVPGWQHSRGMLSELKHAKNLNKTSRIIRFPEPCIELLGNSPYVFAINQIPSLSGWTDA